jgi:Peptidase C13 family
MIGFIRNLFIAWRALLVSVRFRAIKLTELEVSFKQAAAMAALSLFSSVLIAWVALKWQGSGPLKFNLRGIEGELMFQVGLLATSAAAAHFVRLRASNTPSHLLLFIVLAGASVAINLLAHIFNESPLSFAPWLFIAWLPIFGFITIWKGLRLSVPNAFICVVPMLLIFAFQYRYPPADFWVERPSNVARINPATEANLDKQSTLLSGQLAAIQPQREGIRDVYFLGFAPFATEDVFKLELDSLMPLMEQRFDAKGRSLRLSNHLQTIATYPWASVGNLRRALFAIAGQMNAEEDVFVMYLTSHGSRQHDLVSRMPPIEFNEINPQVLRMLLDASGIKHRVIIVSACYSGGFIEPLKSPTTLVMTASAADRTSFGCGAESTFTYFGKAVMDEQLRKTRSFEEAFKNALPILRQREAEKKHVFSDPQLNIGSEIAPVLKALELELETRKN